MTIARPWAIAILVGLFLSLAANLLVVGFAAARFGMGPKPPNLIERIVAFGIRAFPPEIQDSIQKQTRERRDELRTLIDSTAEARMQMFTAMRADPYDPAALEAAFANLQARTIDLQRVGQDIVATAVAAAPADVRSQIRAPRGGGGPFP